MSAPIKWRRNVCEETGLRHESGICPKHGGDGCLVDPRAVRSLAVALDEARSDLDVLREKLRALEKDEERLDLLQRLNSRGRISGYCAVVEDRERGWRLEECSGRSSGRMDVRAAIDVFAATERMAERLRSCPEAEEEEDD